MDAMRKVGSDALRNLPVVGTLLGLVAVAALGLAYWSNVTGRERYLQSRNFRLLADVAEQTQTILFDAEQKLNRNIRIANPNQKTSAQTPRPTASWTRPSQKGGRGKRRASCSRSSA